MAAQLTSADPQTADTVICFQDNQGLELSATLLRLTRFQVAFEVYSPASTLRASEVLNGFTILIGKRPVYTGRAVVTSLVNAGAMLVCEVKLEDAWVDLDSTLPTLEGGALRAGFTDFIEHWNRVYKIVPEYKGVIADMYTFLADLRLWLDQVELGIRSSPSGDRVKLEHEVASELGQATTSTIGELFERFEAVTSDVERNQGDQRAAHSAFAKRLLHPLLLCSPFLYRTFRKPLGYAGDYEMVNMICRDPLEGSTLFAKIINLWFLRQPPAEAHRNRVRWLADRVAEVTARAAQTGRIAQILSVGCGPAVEVQRFLTEKDFANHAHFTLIDFNQETSEHVRGILDAVKRKHNRQTQVQVVKKSVNQILKEAGRSVQGPPRGKYDFVYCAGLFDYLPDQTCRVLSNIFYEWIGPGGLLVSTNVDGSNPRRLTMDYIMDWHLIYRRGVDLAALKPEPVAADEGAITSDATGVNIFYSVRKPNLG
jgi:extracellular factor (EF) 3-hydroxypalmitic acid methyl ester biosynthesis protein